MNISKKIIGLSCLAVLAITSCKKDKIDEYAADQISKVYMPWAVGTKGYFSVLDSGKIVVDTSKNTVNVPVPVRRGGFVNTDQSIVDVSFDDQKVNALIQDGTLPANTVLLPSDCYTLESKDTVIMKDFAMKGTVTPKIKLDKLPAYAGKKVAIAVKISNSSKYDINADQNTVVLFIDVDRLVASYLMIPIAIVNPGFENNYNGWITVAGAAELKNTTGRTGKDLNFWSSSVTSGSVLQSFSNLRNGNYTLSAWYKSAGTGMFMVANDVQVALTPQGNWTKISIDFTVTDHTAQIGFQAVNAGGNFGAWEPWCDMDDFTLTLKL